MPDTPAPARTPISGSQRAPLPGATKSGPADPAERISVTAYLRPAQPLNGQRCLTRTALAAALPLARGWGAETGMTIDLMRKGMRITEVEVPLSHRPTGNDWRSQLHRLAQLRDVSLALAVRAAGTRRDGLGQVTPPGR